MLQSGLVANRCGYRLLFSCYNILCFWSQPQSQGASLWQKQSVSPTDVNGLTLELFESPLCCVCLGRSGSEIKGIENASLFDELAATLFAWRMRAPEVKCFWYCYSFLDTLPSKMASRLVHELGCFSVLKWFILNGSIISVSYNHIFMI